MDKTLDVGRAKILSGSALKLIACISMLSDHVAKFYFYKFAWAKAVLFSIVGRDISLVKLMVMFGRFAFPIFVFLLVVGFENTRNRTRYGISLFVLAFLSEIPFNLMNGHSVLFPKQNVMFTLLFGYLAMCSLEFFKEKPLAKLVSLVAIFLISRYIHVDYQSIGFVFILLMYGLRNEKVIRCAAMPVLLPMKLMIFLSMTLTLLYNGQRGFIKKPFVKYCFYAFYPVHMLVIYLLSC